MSSYRQIIVHEFEARKRRNPAYSLRAFAKSLDISPATLSGIMSGKRNLGSSLALKFADQLKLTPRRRDRFLKTALGESGLPEWDASPSGLIDLEHDRAQLIASGHYFSILSLGSIPHNRWDADWIAEALNIDKAEASEAMLRLERLGLIAKLGEGFEQAVPSFKIQSPLPSESIQKGHRKLLAQAAESLTKHSLGERDFSAMTLAVSSERLEEARQCIARFREEMYTILSAADKNDRIYTLAVQLFPQSRTFDDDENPPSLAH